MLVAIRTGLRVGEMVALRWQEDIDLERGRLRVQRSHSRKGGGFTPPKNNKSREVPLTRDASEALRQQRQRAHGSTLVFPPDRGDVLTHHMTAYAIEKIAKRAGLRHVHNHMLRHAFASHAIMRGIPLRQVQEWLGHASITMTQRYAHLSASMGDEMIRRLDRSSASDQSYRRETSERAAKLQHVDSTQIEAPPNSPRQHHLAD